MERLRFRWGDAIAAGAILMLAALIAVLFWLHVKSDSPLTVQIYRDGTLLAELPLDTDAEYRIEGAYENVVTIRGGRAAVTHATCPGEDCVHTGWISDAGRSIFCLPNRVEIRISGESAVDTIAR